MLYFTSYSEPTSQTQEPALIYEGHIETEFKNTKNMISIFLGMLALEFRVVPKP